MPSASATVSWVWIARQARPVRLRSRLTQSSSVSAALPSRMKYQTRLLVISPAAERRRVDHDAGREAALGLVLPAEIDHDEVQRQRADREIEPAQPQRGQAEDDAEDAADHRGSWQRDPERRVDLADQDADGEGAGRQQPGMAERDLAAIASQQHQRQRADRGEKDLAGEVELKGRGIERPGDGGDREQDECDRARTASAAAPMSWR